MCQSCIKGSISLCLLQHKICSTGPYLNYFILFLPSNCIFLVSLTINNSLGVHHHSTRAGYHRTQKYVTSFRTPSIPYSNIYVYALPLQGYHIWIAHGNPLNSTAFTIYYYYYSGTIIPFNYIFIAAFVTTETPPSIQSIPYLIWIKMRHLWYKNIIPNIIWNWINERGHHLLHLYLHAPHLKTLESTLWCDFYCVCRINYSQGYWFLRKIRSSSNILRYFVNCEQKRQGHAINFPSSYFTACAKCSAANL